MKSTPTTKKKKVSFKPVFLEQKYATLPVHSVAEEEEIFNLIIKAIPSSRSEFVFGFNQVNRAILNGSALAVFFCAKDIAASSATSSQILTHLPMLCSRKKCPLFGLPKGSSKEVSIISFPIHKRKPFITIFAIVSSASDNDSSENTFDQTENINNNSINNNNINNIQKLLSFIQRKNFYITESQ